MMRFAVKICSVQELVAIAVGAEEGAAEPLEEGVGSDLEIQ